MREHINEKEEKIERARLLKRPSAMVAATAIQTPGMIAALKAEKGTGWKVAIGTALALNLIALSTSIYGVYLSKAARATNSKWHA